MTVILGEASVSMRKSYLRRNSTNDKSAKPNFHAPRDVNQHDLGGAIKFGAAASLARSQYTAWWRNDCLCALRALKCGRGQVCMSQWAPHTGSRFFFMTIKGREIPRLHFQYYLAPLSLFPNAAECEEESSRLPASLEIKSALSKCGQKVLGSCSIEIWCRPAGANFVLVRNFCRPTKIEIQSPSLV